MANWFIYTTALNEREVKQTEENEYKKRNDSKKETRTQQDKRDCSKYKNNRKTIEFLVSIS